MKYEKIKIGDLVILRQGFAINKKTNHHISTEPTSLHLLRIGDMKDGNFSIYVKDTIPDKFIAKEDDVIFTRTGQVGLVFRGQRGIVHNNCFTVTTKDNELLLQEFIFYALQEKAFYEEAISRATGAAQPDLPHGAFSSIPIFLPCIKKQKKIVDILQAYDDLIENNQKKIKLLEEAAQRLYKEWFVDFRFPGYEDTKFIDGIPDGWRKERIGNLFLTVLGGTPSRANANYWNGNIPWINSGEINALRIMKESEFITDLGLKNSSTKLMPKHTTVLAITGATLGQVSYTEIETCANQSVVGIVDEKDLYSEYLYLYVSNNIWEIIGKATGGAQQHINKDIVNVYHIVLPKDTIIANLKSYIKPIFTKIANLYNQNTKLEEARDRLLPKLMSGEIEV